MREGGCQRINIFALYNTWTAPSACPKINCIGLRRDFNNFESYRLTDIGLQARQKFYTTPLSRVMNKNVYHRQCGNVENRFDVRDISLGCRRFQSGRRSHWQSRCLQHHSQCGATIHRTAARSRGWWFALAWCAAVRWGSWGTEERSYVVDRQNARPQIAA